MVIKKTAALLLGVLIGVFCLAGCGQTGGTDLSDNDAAGASGAAETQQTEESSKSGEIDYYGKELKEFSEDELLSGKHHVKMEIKDKGTITLELDADQAPISVTSFCQLAKSGFYDGLTFHRIIAGTFMQGGDPLGSGIGGPGYTIKGEFAANNVNNTLSHTRGAISMARTQDYNGGGCQFFIMDQDYTAFDGQYACFGYVTEGMDVVDDICTTVQALDNNGTIAPEDQPVITKVTVID
jgi:Peptidyl-prolyl cis-trans isomerase (rotamase) - cyclophilin family